MINVFDGEAIVKIYRLLEKRCEVIDKFIKNHAYYFGPCSAEYGAIDVCNNIIDLIEKKNELINLKVIADEALSRLSEQDRKVLFIKMHYNISMAELCGVLDLKERTAFRRIERAFENFSQALNASRYVNKLEKILRSHEWIAKIREDVKDRRIAFRPAMVNSI